MKTESSIGRALPIMTRKSGRSSMTCAYPCGNACAHQVPNKSDNAYFGDILYEVVSRRNLLKGGAAAGIVLYAGRASSSLGAPHAGKRNGALTFEPVAPNSIDDVIVPDDYDYDLLVRWGDPILPGAPKFDFNHQTAEAQAQQSVTTATSSRSLPARAQRALEPACAAGRQPRVHKRRADVP